MKPMAQNAGIRTKLDQNPLVIFFRFRQRLRYLLLPIRSLIVNLLIKFPTPATQRRPQQN
jgi:hypothetical protein